MGPHSESAAISSYPTLVFQRVQIPLLTGGPQKRAGGIGALAVGWAGMKVDGRAGGSRREWGRGSSPLVGSRCRLEERSMRQRTVSTAVNTYSRW
jgi:hypothetical protein